MGLDWRCLNMTIFLESNFEYPKFLSSGWEPITISRKMSVLLWREASGWHLGRGSIRRPPAERHPQGRSTTQEGYRLRSYESVPSTNPREAHPEDQLIGTTWRLRGRVHHREWAMLYWDPEVSLFSSVSDTSLHLFPQRSPQMGRLQHSPSKMAASCLWRWLQSAQRLEPWLLIPWLPTTPSWYSLRTYFSGTGTDFP